MRALNLADFGHLTSPQQVISTTILEGEIPTLDEVKALAKWDSYLLKTVTKEHTEGAFDRSSTLAAIAYRGAELGWNDEQIFGVLRDTDNRWGKYAGRADQDKRLLDFINRARQKHGYGPAPEFDIDRIINGPVKVVDEDAVEDALGVVSIDDLNALELNVEWLVEGVIPECGLGLLTGRQGTGKTQIALQLAASLATGQDHFLCWPIPRRGARKVLFLSLEMGAVMLKRFTTPLRRNYADATLSRNLPLLPAGESIPLDTEPGQAYFDKLLDRHKPDLVIIDSLEAIASTELTDELGSKKLMNFLVSSRQKHTTAILVIHHHRKRSNDFASQKRANTIYDVFGANIITSKPDFVLDVDKWRDSKGEQPDKNRLTITTLKNRLAPELDHPIDVKRDSTLHFTVWDEDAANRIAGDLIDGFDAFANA